MMAKRRDVYALKLLSRHFASNRKKYAIQEKAVDKGRDVFEL
jgi:hypothetical protein